jgi:hypothetical protein
MRRYEKRFLWRGSALYCIAVLFYAEAIGHVHLIHGGITVDWIAFVSLAAGSLALFAFAKEGIRAAGARF